MFNFGNHNHSNWFWNEQDMFFGIEGVTIWFRLIKPNCNLELRSLDIALLFWTLERYSDYTPNTSKVTKIIQIGFEMNKINSFEVKVIIV